VHLRPRDDPSLQGVERLDGPGSPSQLLLRAGLPGDARQRAAASLHVDLPKADHVVVAAPNPNQPDRGSRPVVGRQEAAAASLADLPRAVGNLVTVVGSLGVSQVGSGHAEGSHRPVGRKVDVDVGAGKDVTTSHPLWDRIGALNPQALS